MKIHIIFIAAIVGCFFGARYYANSNNVGSTGATADDSSDASPEAKVSSAQQKPSGQGTSTSGAVAMPSPKEQQHFEKLGAYIPKSKTGTLLMEMAKIEAVSMTPEHEGKYRAWMAEVASDPQESFDTLSKSVDALPEEFEKERSRFLQIAVAMDVSQEQKKELIEKVLLDGRYANDKIDNQLSKVMAFDLMLEYGDPTAAEDVLEKGQFKGELAKVLKAQLASRKPAQK